MDVYILRSFCRRSFHRFAPGAGAVVALTAGLLGLFCAPARAAGRAGPSMSITASTSTIVGLQVFANVNLSGGANPTGTIAFKLFSPGDTSCSSPIFSTTTAVTGVSVNSQRFTTSAAGTYRWQATYSGDTNNNPIGPTPCTSPSAAVIVSPAATGLSVSAAPPSAGVIHATALLGGFKPTGTITFLLSPPGDTFCSATPVFSSVVVVSATGTYNSAGHTPTVTGSYKWRAIYSGDGNNNRYGPTACLDSGAAVNVTSVTAGPPTTHAPVTTSATTPKATTGTSTAAQNNNPAGASTAMAGTPAAASTAMAGTPAAAGTHAAAEPVTSAAATSTATPSPQAVGVALAGTKAGVRSNSLVILAAGAAAVAGLVIVFGYKRRRPASHG